MDVVKLSNTGVFAAMAALVLLSGTHLGHAQTSAPAGSSFVPADELTRHLDEAWRPATRTPAFSLSGPVLLPAPSAGPTVYGASLYSLPRFQPAASGLDALIEEAARRFDIPPAWVRRIMRIESGGRTMLDGRPITSPAGAMGLMQVMPTTFAELSGRYGLGSDPYEPRANILAGAAYLREMYDRFGPTHFLAAYNAGPGRVDEHLRTGRPLPGETQRYVQALGPELVGNRTADRSVASTDVRDLTSSDALRTGARPPSWRPSDRSGARHGESVFAATRTASGAAGRQSAQQPNDALFVRLTRADLRAKGGARDGSEE